MSRAALERTLRRGGRIKGREAVKNLDETVLAVKKGLYPAALGA
jgi:hypothetical protein